VEDDLRGRVHLIGKRLEWNATLIKGDVARQIARLKQEPGEDIEMYGSASLMQTLMKHNLIDEYRIFVSAPVW
jgi:dihydrofolate reductase